MSDLIWVRTAAGQALVFSTRTVGQSFGIVGLLLLGGPNGIVVYTTETIPLGMTGVAIERCDDWASRQTSLIGGER